MIASIFLDALRLTANKFAALSYAQFKSTYLMSTPVESPSVGSVKYVNFSQTQGAMADGEISVNWVTAGYSTPVKDQGACGQFYLV